MTALVHDGVIARTYLSYLASAGFFFERIRLLIYQAPGSRLSGFVPAALRTWYARHSQAAASLYWVRHLPQHSPEASLAVSQAVTTQFDLACDFYQRLTMGFRYEDLAKEVIPVHLSSLRDPALEAAVQSLPPGPILFTGGGILPRRIVSDPDRPFIHVHPGLLPQIRGADGLLWSTAVLGHPSASCFVMAPGLDTGAVIARAEFPPLTFALRPNNQPDPVTLYRLLYAYYDPVVRAKLLLKVITRGLEQGVDLLLKGAVPQDLRKGQTYNFMHPVLRDAVLERIFPIQTTDLPDPASSAGSAAAST